MEDKNIATKPLDSIETTSNNEILTSPVPNVDTYTYTGDNGDKKKN